MGAKRREEESLGTGQYWFQLQGARAWLGSTWGHATSRERQRRNARPHLAKISRRKRTRIIKILSQNGTKKTLILQTNLSIRLRSCLGRENNFSMNKGNWEWLMLLGFPQAQIAGSPLTLFAYRVVNKSLQSLLALNDIPCALDGLTRRIASESTTLPAPLSFF